MDNGGQRGRGKRGKGKRTLLREANLLRAAREAASGLDHAFKEGDIIAIADSMAVQEEAMRYFHNLARAEGAKKRPNLDRCRKLWLDAAGIARDITPYRYSKLASIKIAADPNAMRFKDNVTIDELKGEILEQMIKFFTPDDLGKLISLKPTGIANR